MLREQENAQYQEDTKEYPTFKEFYAKSNGSMRKTSRRDSMRLQ